MTKQEIKDENKQVEGNLLVKGEMRRRRRQMLMETLNSEVPQADVIVTNPTHLAIALKFLSFRHLDYLDKIFQNYHR